MGVFDLPGHQFLQVYAVGMVLTLIAGLILPRWLRPEGRAPRVVDVDGLALLSGGTGRLADAVVARLLAAGSLAIDGRTLVHEGRAPGRTPAERRVLALASPIKPARLDRALRAEAAPIERRLVADGLMIDAGTTAALRWWQASPYLLLLAFGAIKLAVGLSRDRPVGILTALLVVTAVFALIRWGAVDRRTRAAVRLLADERLTADRLRRAPMPAETDRAVALFGTAVLAGSAWAGFHTMRRPDSGDGGSSSSSDSSSDGGSDGGGGCGGGCGGCGS